MIWLEYRVPRNGAIQREAIFPRAVYLFTENWLTSRDFQYQFIEENHNPLGVHLGLLLLISKIENFSFQNRGISPKETLKIPSSEATFGHEETLTNNRTESDARLKERITDIDLITCYLVKYLLIILLCGITQLVTFLDLDSVCYHLSSD